jgi:putative DNA primase/helicase
MPTFVHTSFELPLASHDLANLRASGVTDETIRENALYTEYDSAKLVEILKRGQDAVYTQGGLVFRYRNLEGGLNCFARIRPHTPRIRDGELIKYEQPSGTPCRAYFPKASLPLLLAGDDPFLTEGEKKALALSQIGKAAVAIGGPWSWKKKGTDELIDDLEAIGWHGKTPRIVFDHDKKPETRRYTALAARRLARALRKAGAMEVYAVELPPGKDGAKQGVDDFLVAHGPKAFHELVEQAKPVPILNSYFPLTKPQGRTDANNAARLAAKYEEVIVWVGPWDKWMVWDGSRWKRDQCLAIESKAKDLAASLFDEIADFLRENQQ